MEMYSRITVDVTRKILYQVEKNELILISIFFVIMYIEMYTLLLQHSNIAARFTTVQLPAN